MTSVFLLISIIIMLFIGAFRAQHGAKKHTRIKTLPPASNVIRKSTPQAVTSPPVIVNLAHQDIVTTVFWVGETASADNGFIPNDKSAWDEKWQVHYGGEDARTARNGFLPATFTPLENPFYVALPYNDIDSKGLRKASAKSCPNSTDQNLARYSWCKNVWVMMASKSGKVAYAQWQDVGPYEEDDFNYVFGTSKPKNRRDQKAGLDISPATATYLGVGDVSRLDWQFVDISKVPDGPWKAVVTTSKGDSL